MAARWILLWLVGISCVPHVMAALETNYGDFNYTVDVQFWNAKRKYWDALERCKKIDAWPVTYATKDEYEYIQNWLQTNTNDDVQSTGTWVGLTSYRRPQGAFEWIDGTPLEGFVHDLWDEAGGYPTEVDRKKCVLQLSGKFRNAHCDGGQRYVVCKFRADGEGTLPPSRTPGPCQAGYTAFIDQPDKCFKVVTRNAVTGVTFDEAASACQQDGPTAELASFRTDSNHQKAQLLSVMGEKVTGYWLGLYKFPNTYWSWLDNSPLKTSVSGYKEKCGIFLYDIGTGSEPGTLQEKSCQEKTGYICQINAGNPDDVIVTSPAPSTLCPDTWDFYRQGCYKLFPATLSWDRARAQCDNASSEASSLVAIHSLNENAYVQSQYVLTLKKEMWIGFYKEQGYVEYQWSNGWVTSYVNWEGHYSGPGKRCVLMKLDGVWQATDCSIPRPVLCEIPLGGHVTEPPEAEGFCPEEWLDSGSYCYSVTAITHWNSDRFSWLESMEQCLMSDRNAVLSSIHSPVTNTLLAKAEYTQYDNGLWIGLFRGKDGHFRWLDGSPLQYENWATGYPENDTSKSCVYMHRTGIGKGYWFNAACESAMKNERRGFSCMLEKEVQPSIPPATKDTCPDDNWDQYGDECFLFASNTEERYDRAQEACHRYAGSHLVTIRNAEENKYVRALLHKRNAHAMHADHWIGIQIKAGGGYKWDSGDGTTYTNFLVEPTPSEYDDLCVAMDTAHGKWVTQSCALSKGFACRLDKGEFHKRDELSSGEVAGIVCGTIILTVAVAAALFFGAAYILNKRNIKLKNLPFGFENVLYGVQE